MMAKARATMSREARAAYVEIEKGVDRVAADRTLTDARAVAESVIERFRRTVRG
jgi:hypothetical protein